MQKKKEVIPADEQAVIKIRSDAFRLLSFRARSVKEMRMRLKLRHYPDELIESTVEFLKLHGFLNDEQFAKLYATSRTLSRPSGKGQLAFELERKGVPKNVVARTMENLTEYDERAAARELVRPRFLRMTGVTDDKKKARLFAFLKRRGFPSGVILDVLKELFSEVEDMDH